MMPPATFSPPSTTLPARITAPVTGSVVDFDFGGGDDFGAPAGVERAARGSSFARGRASKDLGFAWSAFAEAAAFGLLAVAFGLAAAAFAAAPVFGFAVVRAADAGLRALPAAAFFAAAALVVAPLVAVSPLSAGLAPPRLSLRRPGRERGRLPITPGSSLMGREGSRGLDHHEPLGALERLEAVARVQPVRVARREQVSPHAAHFGVVHDRRDQRLAEAAAALALEDVDVGEPRERRAIGHHAREADLLVAAVDAERDRVGDRLLDGLARDSARPVALFRQER